MSRVRPASGEGAWYGRLSTLRHNSSNGTSTPSRSSHRPASTASETSSTSLKKTKPKVFVNWPKKPQPLRRGGFVAGFSGLTDCLAILISIAFFVHGVFIFQYNGVATKDIPNLKLLQDAAKYFPTVFPILFAAIVGQALHAIALWRLECGEPLQVLDQLLGSTTIFGTITTQLKFWSMGALGAALILLWSFSPLGGQASLRVLEFAIRTMTSSATLLYLDLAKSAYLPGNFGIMAPDPILDQAMSHGLAHSSLMAPMSVKNSPMDSWGNVKIPFIEVAAKTGTPDEQGWYQLTPENTIYSSLIGLPMSSLSPSKNATFKMDTEYMTMSCTTLVNPYDAGIEPQFNFLHDTIVDQDNLDIYALSNACWGLGTNMWLEEFEGVARRVNASYPNMPPRIIIYKGIDDDSNFSHAECELRNAYVELDVSCIGRNCKTTRIRRSRQPHMPEGRTPLDHEWGSFQKLFWTLYKFLPCSLNQQPPAVIRYFTRPHAPYNDTPDHAYLYDLSKESFGHSLAQIFNSFHIAGAGLQAVPNNLPGNIPGGEPVSMVLPPGTLVHDTVVTLTDTELVLVCNHIWLTVLLIATALMFLLGIWGLVLEHMRRTPDIAMNISSMTRDNPYVDIPKGGTVMDAAERMRRLRDVRVRLGDVKADETVGWVAIATYADGAGDEEDGEEGRFVDVLQEGRVYA